MTNTPREAQQARRGTAPAMPRINALTVADLRDCLMLGLSDFARAPLYGLFFGGVFAASGIAIVLALTAWDMPWMIYPFAIGFPLVGPFAAAGLYALEHNIERLAEDHANAERLAKGLKDAGYEVDGLHTNMVFVRIPQDKVSSLKPHFEGRGVLVLPGPRLRLVTHLAVDAAGIARALDAFRSL